MIQVCGASAAYIQQLAVLYIDDVNTRNRIKAAVELRVENSCHKVTKFMSQKDFQ